MLTVHRGNRLESLADALVSALAAKPLPPLTAEVVVVQSLGMRRWLSYALAERVGVAMNIAFPFPATLVERTFNALAPKSPVSPILRREVLPWKIHALLPTLWDTPAFADLARYADGNPLKQWQLARQIAEVFDRYLAYRPQLLRQWDQGADDPDYPWQSQLWRALDATHPAGLARMIESTPTWANSALPARISVFAPSTLPPFYLELLGELGRRTTVQLYLLAPTIEYWGDLRGEKEEVRFRRWCAQHGREPGPETPTSEGHALLASLGKIGREFHEAVLDLNPAAEPVSFVEPTGTQLLSQLQRSIFSLATPDAPVAIATDDRSIQLHNCHSPLRELEVLHDQLLALFAADSTLEPRDVLVSVPDIGAYAPFIDAVFGAPENPRASFPYSIADRDARTQNDVTDAFLRILDLAGSRFTATAVLSVLDCPPVGARFGIADSDLPTIRRWVAESGVRWGIDADHRERLGFPRWRENTWQFGLDRLLLGFALPERNRELFEDILPHGNLEGSSAETLGRFATFFHALVGAVESLTARPRTPLEWAEHFSGLLAGLCASDDAFADRWRETAQAVEALADAAELAENREPIPFAVVHDHVQQALANSDRGNEFLRGGVTFCSLKPMRAIPHRIVALLGLNEGTFPRTTRPPSFDLTSARPRPGDRTIRDDDRYLFLESLIGARDVLYLSHCGQSGKDDSKSPPSVLVVEFLDFLNRHFCTPDGRPVSEQLTVLHPLQPFHRIYFTSPPGSAHFSYSRECAAAATVAAAERSPRAPFVSPSPLPALEPGDLPLETLVKALLHPTKYFAQEILGLRLPSEEATAEDVEPIELDGLARYALNQELTDYAVSGCEPLEIAAAIRASGVLPQGFTGEITYATAADLARSIAHTVHGTAPGTPAPTRFGTVTLGSWRLRGSITGERGGYLVRVRPAAIKAKDLLRAWCQHLFACALEPDTGHRTLLVGKDDTAVFQAVDHADAELEKLIGLFARIHTRPVPFFPAASYAYAKAVHRPKPKSIEDAVRDARREWTGSDFGGGKGEGEDEWNKIVWRPPADPFDEEWRLTASEVFQPMQAHIGTEASA